MNSLLLEIFYLFTYYHKDSSVKLDENFKNVIGPASKFTLISLVQAVKIKLKNM